jgi:hypothetical protein
VVCPYENAAVSDVLCVKQPIGSGGSRVHEVSSQVALDNLISPSRQSGIPLDPATEFWALGAGDLCRQIKAAHRPTYEAFLSWNIPGGTLVAALSAGHSDLAPMRLTM